MTPNSHSTSELAADRPVAALVQDLFFASKISETLRHLQRPCVIAPRWDGLEQQVRAQQAAMVLVDLGRNPSDAIEAVRRLRAAPDLAALPVVAFGSHRDIETRERALAAGCTEVVANSKLVADLPGIVERYCGVRRPS